MDLAVKKLFNDWMKWKIYRLKSDRVGKREIEGKMQYKGRLILPNSVNNCEESLDYKRVKWGYLDKGEKR